MASQRHRGKLTVACLRSPPRSPSPNHPRDVAGNPDASRCFVGRDSDRPAPHGSPDRGGSSGSAARPRAGRRAAPSVHNLVRSKSGRDHSGCRPAPEPCSARTKTAGPSSPPRATAHMDVFGNDWNTAPACVLSTVAAHLSGAFLPRATQPPQQQSAARHASLWICGQHKSVAHKPTGPTATADNLNELESVVPGQRPGPPQRQPSRRRGLGATTSSAVYTRVLIAIHMRRESSPFQRLLNTCPDGKSPHDGFLHTFIVLPNNVTSGLYGT